MTFEEGHENDDTKKRNEPSDSKPRRPRGFAAMDRTRVSQIASKGGRAAHKAGTAHEFTSEEARAAGKKASTSKTRVARPKAQSAHEPTRASADEDEKNEKEGSEGEGDPR
jgi:general stress protein YciG